MLSSVTTAAPRARAMAWTALGLSCALHGAVAWLLWRGAPEHAVKPARHDDLFVDLLPAPLARAEAPVPVLPLTRPAGAQSGPPAPASSLMPAGTASARRPGASPRQSASAPSAKSAATPARDFRWRPEDAAALGMPHAQGEPRVRLAPRAAPQPSALAQGIARSARASCRDAHAHLGLLAAPLLLVDALRDDGCKW